MYINVCFFRVSFDVVYVTGFLAQLVEHSALMNVYIRAAPGTTWQCHRKVRVRCCPDYISNNNLTRKRSISLPLAPLRPRNLQGSIPLEIKRGQLLFFPTLDETFSNGSRKGEHLIFFVSQ